MSYILEALKKSEQERNPDKVPDLTTHHRAVSVEQKSARSWAIPVTLLVIINLGAIYWFMIRDTGPQQAVQTAEAGATKPTEAPRQLIEMKPETEANTAVETKAVETQPPIQQQPIQTEKQTEQQIKQQPVRTQTQTEIRQPVSQPEVQTAQQQPTVIGPPKFSALPHITELSQGIQNQLPAITFSTHIFVKEGGSFVIINNRNLSQGMTISSGLVLEKIVREGVILSFRDRYFTLNSMESWQK